MPERIRNFFSNFKLRERMLLIYILGGILPLFIANIYMYRSVTNIRIEQEKEAEIQTLDLMAEALGQSAYVLEEVSKRLYFDEDLEKIASANYNSYEEMIEDYNAFTTFSDYLSDYYQEISEITIYMYNTTLRANDYFTYADATVKSSDWYIEAVKQKGRPYWFFEYDSLKKRNNLCLARMIYDRNQNRVGVVKLTMQNNRSELGVSESPEHTMLIYKAQKIIHSNQKWDYDEEILTLLQEEKEEAFARKVTIGGQKYLLSGVKVELEYSDSVYTYVNVKPYKEILLGANIATMQNLLPIFLGLILGIIFIFWFSKSVSYRINTFRGEMHKAATGDFEIADSIGGKDEFAELYVDLTHMISDIQRLMNEVIQEQVAKEQLNAREKEVEFKMLSSQINPHFLYNTLETIRMQARINQQPNIEELAKMLAKIMRHNIQVGDRLQKVTEEVRLVQYYLKIQDYRFHDRISYEINMDEEEVGNLMMLPLLIQPYVENSFVHGLEQKTSGGIISIDVTVDKDLWIIITDNGCGMSEEKLEEVRFHLNDFDNLDRTHIGICNVNQRIKLQYGDNYGVKVDSQEGVGTKVTIKLPKID